MVATTVAYVTGVVGGGKGARRCLWGHVGYSIATPIAGGGLPVVRYEDALSLNHDMRWYMCVSITLTCRTPLATVYRYVRSHISI